MNPIQTNNLEALNEEVGFLEPDDGFGCKGGPTPFAIALGL
jgi:hypothetical protein